MDIRGEEVQTKCGQTSEMWVIGAANVIAEVPHKANSLAVPHTVKYFDQLSNIDKPHVEINKAFANCSHLSGGFIEVDELNLVKYYYVGIMYNALSVRKLYIYRRCT